MAPAALLPTFQPHHATLKSLGRGRGPCAPNHREAHPAQQLSQYISSSSPTTAPHHHPTPASAPARAISPNRGTLGSRRLRPSHAREGGFGEPATMRTRSQAKAAMSAVSLGGGGRGRVKRKVLSAPPVAAAEAAAGENLVENPSLEVDADVVMVAGAAEEVAAVESVVQEGNCGVMGDAVIIDAGTVGDVAEASDFLYEAEPAGVIDMGVDIDGSGENIGVLNGGCGGKGKMGLEADGLQSEEEAASEIVELSSYSEPHHGEAECSEPNNSDRFARYSLPRLDNGGIRVSDLVWIKLEGYPWWPGEIFDPSDASELALQHQVKGNYLVALFGDRVFAWSDESQLMPFITNYARMEKQCSSDDFINAVNHALEEFSRRVLSGMSCSCLPEELSDSGMSYMVENHGLKDGVTCCTVNKAEFLKYFNSENLLHYVKSLALFPGQGGDLLELVAACSQLTSFYRSKGSPELASFQTSSGWDDNAMDASSTMNVTVEEDVTNVVHSDHAMPKRGRGRPRKRKPEDSIESMEKKGTSNLINSATYDDFNYSQNMSKGNLDSFEDSVSKSHRSTERPDHMQDSYWSELSLHSDPIHSLEIASSSTRPRHKRKSSQENYVPPSQHPRPRTAPKKQIQVMERPIIHADAKIADELKPTALVLSFGRPGALPSEMDLIKTFSRYGPLKETETEVHQDTNTAKVVFKKRLDAERGFSVAGKYGTFGPSLRSYRLFFNHTIRRYRVKTEQAFSILIRRIKKKLTSITHILPTAYKLDFWRFRPHENRWSRAANEPPLRKDEKIKNKAQSPFQIRSIGPTKLVRAPVLQAPIHDTKARARAHLPHSHLPPARRPHLSLPLCHLRSCSHLVARTRQASLPSSSTPSRLAQIPSSGSAAGR
ncbi:hypothetical protein EJB05_35889, partial [Eragrostis curvula]